MARASIYLPKFNAACKFVVARSFLVSGRQQEKGVEFDKTSIPERRLRQLMDQRKLTQLPQDNKPKAVTKAPPPLTSKVVETPVVETGLSRDKVARAMPVSKINKGGKKNVRQRKR